MTSCAVKTGKYIPENRIRMGTGEYVYEATVKCYKDIKGTFKYEIVAE